MVPSNYLSSITGRGGGLSFLSVYQLCVMCKKIRIFTLVLYLIYSQNLLLELKNFEANEKVHANIVSFTDLPKKQ